LETRSCDAALVASGRPTRTRFTVEYALGTGSS
jgi:hypothetical protein